MQNIQNKSDEFIKRKYNIGLDIGTNSVGWAVTDAATGEVLRFKHKNMLGSRLFEEGKSAKERRVQRNVRRRYNRRKERIGLLRELMQEDILTIDENFYRRLDEGFLQIEDKTVRAEFILFNDGNYTDRDYYTDYKTIYHLRNELCENKEKKDIRLVYLALHNLIKYRGHFLYQGQKFADINGNLKELFNALAADLQQKCDCQLEFNESQIKSAEEILKDKTISKKQKLEKLNGIFEIVSGNKKKAVDNEEKILAELVKMILGYTADFAVVFDDEGFVDDKEQHLKIALSNTKYEEKEDDILDRLQEKADVLEDIKRIYSWFVLQNVLQGQNTAAKAMIGKYNKHKEDLQVLKDVVNRKLSPREKTYFFRKEFASEKSNKESGKKVYIHNYVNYIAGEKRCDREQFYTAVKKLLENIEDSAKDYILAEIEKESFMPLLNSKDNAAIPYQLTLWEAEKIIDNQGEYYPNLKSNKEKILSLITFRIPYYVGPLNDSSKFHWIERKSRERIYPWNFSEMVDEDTTAEEFIKRMTNKCTYLKKEDVIPKNSLLYSRFVLLNELNKIKINGKTIPYKDKQDIIQNVFMKCRNVKEKTLMKYLKSINYQNAGAYDIEGYQKDKEFSATLSSYIDMKKIFGDINQQNTAMIEEIIYWLTIFEEKDIIKRKIKDKYSDSITKEQADKICKLRYKGWSRLSKRLLEELKAELPDCSKVSIMDILETTNLNFMQIIHDKKYGFDKLIEKENDANALAVIDVKDVMDLPGSPAIKRGIWQTVRVINEIVEIMQGDPENIFIEFAREEQKKQRTTSRLNSLKKCYAALKEETDEYNKEADKNLKNKKYSDKLDSERMLLYFMQNGKCMYSGEPLDIDSLQLYQVDHIVPQAYIKDDSIENKALVKGELNQYKSDKLFLDAGTRARQKTFWLNLKKAGLIGVKKYNNLIKESASDSDRKGFINRQLVETRQISKHVAALFLQRFVNSNVVTIRANLSHDFREKYGIYKSRELNDFHHAHDAFLAAEIGGFLMKRFPGLKDELIYDAFNKYYTSSNKGSFLKEKWGYILSLFDKEYVTEDGAVIWQGNKDINYMKSVICSSDCRVTKKLEELTGKFYDETVYGAQSGKEMIPLKKNLPVEKYGGYAGKSMAFFMVVQFKKGKKQIKKLVGIPLHINALVKTQPDAVKVYLQQKLGVEDYVVLKEHILKNQLVIENGSTLFLVSDSEVVNAKQFFFGEKYEDYQKLLLRVLSRHVSEAEKPEVNDKLGEIFRYIVNKTQKQYKLYADTFQRIDNALDFGALPYDKKVECIIEMLKLLKANPECANMAKFNEVVIDKQYKLVDRMGRKNSYKLDIENTIFVDQSVTGLYERRYKI